MQNSDPFMTNEIENDNKTHLGTHCYIKVQNSDEQRTQTRSKENNYISILTELNLHFRTQCYRETTEFP